MLSKFLLGLCLLIANLTHIAKAESCINLEEPNQREFDRSVLVRVQGKSCLNHDILQPTKPWWAWESCCDTSPGMVYIFTYVAQKESYAEYDTPGNGLSFDIDLKQHTLTGNGVGFASGGESRIKIKNGIFKNVRIGIKLLGRGGELKLINSEYLSARAFVNEEPYEDTPKSITLDKKPPAYQPTDFLVDKLSIHAKYRGIIMEGGNNIIRNSTIEVDGHTAIYMFGPNPIIENNTIIIHGEGDEFYMKGKGIQKDKNGEWIRDASGEIKDFKGTKVYLNSAPIKLRDAHHAIIRNNRIIYKGGLFSFGKAPTTINLLDSKDVLIENNTIEGFKSLVRKNGDTSFDEKSNTVK